MPIDNTSDILSYYSTHGPTGDPGRHLDLFSGLPAVDSPADLKPLVQAVQGVMLHVFWAERYGVQLSDERKLTVNIRSLVDKLEIYRRLGVREVWFWITGRFWIYTRSKGGYAERSSSAVMPDLDFDRIARIVLTTEDGEQNAAVRAYRRSLRRRR